MTINLCTCKALINSFDSNLAFQHRSQPAKRRKIPAPRRRPTKAPKLQEKHLSQKKTSSNRRSTEPQRKKKMKIKKKTRKWNRLPVRAASRLWLRRRRFKATRTKTRCSGEGGWKNSRGSLRLIEGFRLGNTNNLIFEFLYVSVLFKIKKFRLLWLFFRVSYRTHLPTKFFSFRDFSECLYLSKLNKKGSCL